MNQDYESISIHLLQDVIYNFPDKNCRLICFTVQSEINGCAYTFSRVNNSWKCTLSFTYLERAPLFFDADDLNEAINRAEDMSGLKLKVLKPGV